MLVMQLSAYADLQDRTIKVGIDEKLGDFVPLDLTLINEQGNEITVAEVIDGKPTILAFVYYSCPSICSPLLMEIASVVNQLDWELGKQFNILTLSIDEYEDYHLASEKKVNFLNIIKKDVPEESWAFLTGDSAAIRQLTDAAGFYFIREGKDFIHTGTLIFLSPEGK
jgi:protein SCO1